MSYESIKKGGGRRSDHIVKCSEKKKEVMPK
jgi:hypothetical protein